MNSTPGPGTMMMTTETTANPSNCAEEITA
jgi:hypothetical protein